MGQGCGLNKLPAPKTRFRPVFSCPPGACAAEPGSITLTVENEAQRMPRARPATVVMMDPRCAGMIGEGVMAGEHPRKEQAQTALLPLVGRRWRWGCERVPMKVWRRHPHPGPPHKGEGKGGVVPRAAIPFPSGDCRHLRPDRVLDGQNDTGVTLRVILPILWIGPASRRRGKGIACRTRRPEGPDGSV